MNFLLFFHSVSQKVKHKVLLSEYIRINTISRNDPMIFSERCVVNAPLLR